MKKNYTTPKMVVKKLDCQQSMLFSTSEQLPDEINISTSNELEDEGIAE